jgi:hypothetical protein
MLDMILGENIPLIESWWLYKKTMTIRNTDIYMYSLSLAM